MDDTLFLEFEQISSNFQQFDDQLNRLNQQYDLKIRKIESEISDLLNEEKIAKSKANFNEEKAKIDEKITKLNDKKNQNIEKRENLKSHIHDLEMELEKSNHNYSPQTSVPSYLIYKSLAPLKLSSHSHKISGVVAYGTRDTTHFFNYNHEDEIEEDFWKKLK